MSTLSSLIYYPRSISLFANGAFVGISICMNFINVPAIKASRDPLPVFLTTYKRGSKIAISSIIIASASNALCYYRTENLRFLYASLFTAAVIPYTLLFMKPTNNQLFALEKDGTNYDRKKVDQLVTQWDQRQYIRTAASISAFLLNILYV